MMRKKIRWVLTCLLLAVFLFSGGAVAVILSQYAASDRLYETAVEEFTAGSGTPAAPMPSAAAENGAEEPPSPAPGMQPEGAEEERETAPIRVDFEALRAVNPDVVGWIYCPDTPINYPLLKGENNDTYLHRSYDGTGNVAGSIFIEELNRPDFSDANTIIYGHNMRNGSMFAALSRWEEQSFYEEHPSLWLLTPERDYRVDLLAEYLTSADSEAYTIFTGPCVELDRYVLAAMDRSAFRTKAQAESGARYVMLSTCAYVFDTSRTVLHGILRPVESAGGIPLP